MLLGVPAPTDLLEVGFLRSALAELLLLAVAGGALGAFVVLRRLAFFSHAVGTASFPGLVAAQAAGLSPKLGGIAVALGYAGGVGTLGRGRERGDAATALLLVAALAAGVVLAGDVFGSGASVDRLLFGTALAVSTGDLVLAAVAALAAAAGAVLLGPAWTAGGFDPDGTASLGIPGRVADVALLGLLALAAVAAIPAVGALLLASMLVVPAATARLFARSVRGLMLLALAVAAAQGVAGLYLAYALDVPAGPAVASLAALVYVAAAIVAAVRT